MKNGKVLWYHKKNGQFGHLRDNNDNTEVFFHWKDIVNLDENDMSCFKVVYPGDPVTYELIDTSEKKDGSRLRAVNITLLPRLSSKNNPILRCSIVKLTDNLDTCLLKSYMTDKWIMGARYINVVWDVMLGTHIKISQETAIEISRAIKDLCILDIVTDKDRDREIHIMNDVCPYDIILI